MRLSGVYPFLEAFHRAIGRSDEEIEELAERAWQDGAEPHAVLQRDDGAWVAWRTLEEILGPRLRAKVLEQTRYRYEAPAAALARHDAPWPDGDDAALPGLQA